MLSRVTSSHGQRSQALSEAITRGESVWYTNKNVSTLPLTGSIAPSFTLRDDAEAVHNFGETDNSPVTLLFFFKHDCETCRLTAPVIERAYKALFRSGLRVIGISQDDSPETERFVNEHLLTFTVLFDTEFDVSDNYGFDAVPAILLTDSKRVVLASLEGWSKSDMKQLLMLAATHCNTTPPSVDHDGTTLPDFRPGCGSRVHDPDIARRLAVRRGTQLLGARRVHVPVDLDVYEFLDDQKLTDGLPIVPPTEDRVLRMLEGTSRPPTDIVATVPPNLAPATVEKVAINAVMAGCKPEYLPVVIAALEAACTDDFNLHGVLATTYFVGPLIIVNGPIRHEIGLNFKRNVFGQGTRANSTIGRALQLIVRNIGGGRPGEVDMSTLGQPGKIGVCIAEYEELSCWEPLHVERGFQRDQSTVTLFAAEAPRAVRDQLSRNARSLAISMGLSMESIAHVKLHGMDQALLVVSPEHARTFERDNYSKSDLRLQIQDTTARPLRDLLPNEECHKGTPLKAVPKDWLDHAGQIREDALDGKIPKFSSPEDILIMVAGGTAGKFSAAVGGWASGGLGLSSKAVTRVIEA